MKILECHCAGRQEIPEGVILLRYRSGRDNTQDWCLLWPPETGSSWAVVIHGHGSRGDQLYVRPDLRVWIAAFRGRNLGILTPNLRGNAWMSPAAASDLKELLSLLRTEFKASRFHFLSGSMGGTSNLIYAVLHPEDVAGCAALGAISDPASYYTWCRIRSAPILREIASAVRDSYGGTPEEIPGIYAAHSALKRADRLTMPVYLCHGEKDTIMPVSQSRALAEALKNRTIFRYEELSGGGHDLPLGQVIPALDWLLSGKTPARGEK